MARRHLDKKLIFRLAIFIAIFLVMVVLISVNVFENKIGILLAGTGLVLGVCIGLASGRVFSIRWNQEDLKVVSRMDKIGIFFLVPYLIFTFLRERILEYWFHGVLLTAFTFSLIAGIMLGRIMYLFFHIKKTLKEEGLYISEKDL